MDITTLIHNVLVSAWENEIQTDYTHGWLLKEDSLKCALYHHIRAKLGSVREISGLRIYTEFTDEKFRQSG